MKNYCIPLLLIMVLLFQKVKFKKNILFESLIGLLFCVVFFIHPVGIFALVLIIYSIYTGKLYKSIPILFFSIIFFSFLLTLGELKKLHKSLLFIGEIKNLMITILIGLSSQNILHFLWPLFHY